MRGKTFSQKAAHVFEIVCYVLLIPAVISILYTLFTFWVLVFIPFTITAIGVVLLAGYRKHSRGKMEENASILWLGTFIFNAIPLTPIFYQVIFNPDRYKNTNLGDILQPPVLFFLLLTLWWIIAVSISITLIWDEIRKNWKI